MQVENDRASSQTQQSRARICALNPYCFKINVALKLKNKKQICNTTTLKLKQIQKRKYACSVTSLNSE